MSRWADKPGGGSWLKFLAAFISAKEGRTRDSYFQVVGIRLVGRCDVLINQQTDVFQGIQPFALQQVDFSVNQGYLESFIALKDLELIMSLMLIPAVRCLCSAGGAPEPIWRV